MHVDLEMLEKKYAEMDQEDFSKVEFADLTEEGKGIYEKELKRRNPADWQTVMARQIENLEVERRARPESFLSSEGRLDRQGYLLRFVLINVAAGIVGFLLGLALAFGANSTSNSVNTNGFDVQQMVLLIFVIGSLAGSWLIIVQAVKRLHDLGRPGTHAWFLFVPLYNIYFSLMLFLKKGVEGPNVYGG